MGNRSSREVYRGHSEQRWSWVEGEGLVHEVDKMLGTYAVSAARGSNVARVTGTGNVLRLINHTLDAVTPSPEPRHPAPAVDDDEQNELPIAA